MRISLTFDNGPTPGVTDGVMAALQARSIPATFFCLGRQLAQQGGRALAERAFAEGHRIGNHTFSHDPPLGERDAEDAVSEITRTAALLADLVGDEPLFRPSGKFGQLGPHLFNTAAWVHLAAGGYTCVTWNCLAYEWEGVDAWVEPTLARARALDWAVVVLHDVARGGMPHLERFLDALLSDGAEFRTDYPEDCRPMTRGAAAPGSEAFVTA